MRVFEFCMFHNEHAALAIKRVESAKWVDELHLCEADLTFRGAPRPKVLDEENAFLKPHLFPGTTRFEPPYRWGISRYPPFIRKKKRARQNEAMQRNYVHEMLDVDESDIIILSDVDEIVDSRRAEELIDAAKKHGVVSVRLHHTLFYLNLYSTNWHEVWPGSPPDYAYRAFVMTGAHFCSMRRSSDRLRKLGEWGKLENEVPLLDGFAGFHHSWLGDEKAAIDKLQSYSHSFSDHNASLINPNGSVNAQEIREAMQAGRSIFPGNTLELRDFNEQAPLQSVTEMQCHLSGLIL